MSNEMVWSFSRVSCYDNCPRCFDLCYNQHVDKKDNAFALWGSLIHKCMELFFKEELDLFSLEDYYREHYDEYVTCQFPYNKYSDLASTYYEAGLEYLGNFNGLDTERYEVLGVEQEFKIPIKSVAVCGFIDLILRDRQNGEIIIVDHKSASSLKGAKLKQYLLQLYIYSAHVLIEYGCYPRKLVFNLFRAGEVVVQDFNLDEFNKALNWFRGMVDKALADTTFNDKIAASFNDKFEDIAEFKRNDYYCNNLCSARAYCERSYDYEGGDIDWLLIKT